MELAMHVWWFGLLTSCRLNSLQKQVLLGIAVYYYQDLPDPSTTIRCYYYFLLF